MDKIRKLRGTARGSFTKTYDKINELLAKEEKDIFEINALFGLLEKRYEEIINQDNDILNLLLDANGTQAELDEERDTADMYILKYNRIKTAVSKLDEDRRSVAAESVRSFAQSNVTNNPKRSFKLPQLELKKFSGDIKGWLQFWTQFRKIDEDESIEAGDKFQYLIQATVAGSKARELVESFPATEGNYPKVITVLKARYGREDLLVEVYVRELLSLVLNNTLSTNTTPLVSLYDKLECHLRALETLNVTTEKCASMLLPLVESCLPEDVLRMWQRNNTAMLVIQSHTVIGDEDAISNITNSSKDRLDQLMKFIAAEVANEQKITLAKTGFGVMAKQSFKKKDHSFRSSNSITEELPTAAGLLTTTTKEQINGCVFCNGSHKSTDCFKAQNMTLTEKRKTLETKNCCFICFRPGHPARVCRNKQRCIICKKGHNVLMCENLPQKTEDKKVNTKTLKKESEDNQALVQDKVLANFSSVPDVWLQTLLVKIRGNGVSCNARAIIDSGSQRSYILKDTARRMNYEPNRKEDIQHSLFGGSTTNICSHDVFKLYLSNLQDTYKCNFDVLDQNIICGPIPSVKPGPWIQELEENNIQITDTLDRPIEILIGADVAGKLLTGGHRILNSGLVAVETKLGWTLMGKAPGQQNKENSALLVTSMLVKEAKITDLWALDVLGISDPIEKKTKDELHAATVDHFLNTVNINEEGRFEVHLPWIENHVPLPSNYNLALRRLDSTVKRINADGLYDEYQNVFNDWLREGVIEEVPKEELNEQGHYLPHHHVVKLNSTTKVRPVFDASAKEKQNPSLNSCLEKGINLIELIPSILLRFRLKRIGVIADIKKAFLQISLFHKDRNFLRFFWFNKEGQLIVYRHRRVVFGVSSSPFLLGAVLHYLLDSVLKQSKEGKLPFDQNIIEQLKESFYVDNCVTSVDNEQDLKQFIEEATEVLNTGKFELRGWEHTIIQPNQEKDVTSNVLGLLWNRQDDTLEINLENLKSLNLDKITKRTILSVAHRVFDPIGVTSCVSLLPKLLLQQAWDFKLSWDQEVSEGIKSQFLNWMKDLPYLSKIKIPRWLTGTNNNRNNWTLHIFCDASKLAYASAAFLRIETEKDVQVQLVQAKARVSPKSKTKKKISIPRLELLAATIGARLYATLITDFNTPNIKTFFWSDATTVLAWIDLAEQWDAFVANRVREIRELTSKCEWRYVPGSMNPADLLSRGCSAKNLVESRWWEGPNWLRDSPDSWPVFNGNYNEDEINEEKKKSVTSAMTCIGDNSNWYYKFFSKYIKIVRLIGWMLRFKSNSLNKSNRNSDDLSAEEIIKAEHKLMQLIQQESFTGVDDSKLSSLCPFVDENGIIRLKTKISNRNDINDFCQPVVLPNHSHPVVFRLIMDVHCDSSHAGVEMMMTILRKQYWILSGRRAIRTVINKCQNCIRQKSKRIEVVPTPLPEDRVRDAKVFEVVGVDVAGPLFLKGGAGETDRKVWVCLYTCGVYRAIHLELLTSLSTDRFLQGLRRFISRRGRPSSIYSDNGTNFVGASNAMANLDWEAISKYSTARKLKWKFNPPTAAWWGGWWERLIGVMKQLLRRVLGRTSLDFEEMQTVLCDCESVINQRPLTYVTNNPNDLVPLTPDMFLKDIEESGVPDINLIETNDPNRRLRYRQNLRAALQCRFRNEYLGQLMLHHDNCKNPKKINIGDIVLVGKDGKKRIDWPLAKVEELIPGRDGEVRVVRLKTATGKLLRPVQRLYPLELDSCPHVEDNLQTKEKEFKGAGREVNKAEYSDRVSSRGRRIKIPKKLDL